MDSQKNRVYAAEQEAFPSVFRNDNQEWRLTPEGVNSFVRDIVRSHHDLDWPLGVTLIVNNRKKAYGGKYGITLPPWGRNKYTICHELAHTICSRTAQPGEQAHGPRFCRTYLALVTAFVAPSCGEHLEKHFRKHHVVLGPGDAKRYKLEREVVKLQRKLNILT
jgi:hypothetical protein